MELFAVFISFVALIGTFISIYYQFFHKPRNIRIITLPFNPKSREIRFGICNGGKESIYVTAISVDHSAADKSGLRFSYSAGNVKQRGKSIIEPGNICEFSYCLDYLHTKIFDKLNERNDFNGNSKRVIDLFVSMEIAYPNGDVFSNKFKCLSLNIKEGQKAISVDFVNLDFLKSATTVLSNKREKSETNSYSYDQPR
jgi:hypothetical protein